MTGIFISYSRKDSSIANKLMTAFKSIELDVWVDWEDIPPAVGWLDQIFQGIEHADAFVFLISPDSLASEVCKVEVAHAQKNAKRIIPIVVRDADPKTAEQTIRDLNWIFLREQDDFDKGLEKVKVAINIDVDWLQEHRRLQVRALEWDRKKDPSLLLRGGDLRNAIRMTTASQKKNPSPSELQHLYISLSRRTEQLRTVIWISTVLAVLVMILLSVLALNQRQAALQNEKIANEQKVKAQESEQLAIDNAKAALIAKASAETNATIAKAQRSAARAQIFQSKTGGLFTSTLLAIDSYRRHPSSEAEVILRKNISLLPVPVKQLEQKGSILHVGVAPDGISFVSTSEDGRACLTRFEDGRILYCVTSSGGVLDAVFSPDGKVLVISSSSGEVQILNAEDGSLLKKLNLGVAVRSVNISPDNRLLAMARDDGRITLIKLSTYEFAGEFSVYGSLRVTSFSPDGKWFAAGSDSGSVTFWNLANGNIVSSGVHRGDVLDIAFSPDSRSLISGGSDNLAVMTSPTTGKQMLGVINEDWVEDVEFSPDGKWFVTASNDFRIRVWDSRSGEERLRLLQDSLVSQVRVSPDGLWIASTGADQTVRVWSAANGAEMFQIPLADVGKVLEFSADSHYLVTGDSGGRVSIWDISALKMNVGYLRFDDFIQNVEMSPTGDWFAASTQGRVWVLDPELITTQTAPQDKPRLDFGDDVVTDMAINPDGTTLAIATDQGQVALYEIAGNGVQTLITSGAQQMIAFSPDGKKLILTNEDGVVQFRNLDSGGGRIILQNKTDVYSMAVSPKGLVALGAQDKVIVFEAETGELVADLKSMGKNQLLKFNPQGDLLSTSTLTEIHIWQFGDKGFEQIANPLGNQAFSMSFNPAGDRLMVGEQDQIRILDPLTGDELYRIRQKGAVTGVTFSTDGNTLFAASLRSLQSFDLTLVKNISGDDIMDSACSRLTQNLNDSEWALFFGDEVYEKLCPSLP